jgi:hypothetical protein
MLKKHDYFNNQFTLEYYLEKYNLDTEVISFAENYDIDIKYVCFLSNYNKATDFHTIVTTNNYRLITIRRNYDADNQALTLMNGYNNYIIIYNDLHITVTSITTLHIIESMIDYNIFNKNVLTDINANNDVTVYNGHIKYHKNFNPHKITSVVNVNDYDILSVLPPISNIKLQAISCENLEKSVKILDRIRRESSLKLLEFNDKIYCASLLYSVKKIILRHPIDFRTVLPPHLEVIEFNCIINFHDHLFLPGMLPNTIHTMSISGNIPVKMANNVLPTNLCNLLVYNCIWLPEHYPDDIIKYKIKKLELQECSVEWLKKLSPTISDIKIGKFNSLPASKTKLNCKNVIINVWKTGDALSVKDIFGNVVNLQVGKTVDPYRICVPESLVKIDMKNINLIPSTVLHFETNNLDYISRSTLNKVKTLVLDTILFHNIYRDCYNYKFQYYSKTPPILKKLVIKQCKHILPPYFLSEGLEELKLLKDYNHEFGTNVLPNSLKKLVLGNEFDKPLNNLPPQLESLKIGMWFNNSLEFIPVTLKKLSLGDSFRKDLINFSNIEKLILGNSYYKHIEKGVLPETLVKLSFGRAYNQPIVKGLFPNSIKFMRLGSQREVFSLPKNLETLEIRFSNTKWITKLPHTINVKFL